MYTPTNGGVGAQPLADAVVSTRYIYTLALALMGRSLMATPFLLKRPRVYQFR